MTLNTSTLCVALLLGLAACSSKPAADEAGTTAKPAAASTAIPDSNPFKPMLDTRNRAKAVEKTIQAHDAAQRKALQDAEQ